MGEEKTRQMILYSYLGWLYDRVYLDGNHWSLIGLLNEIEFTWSVPMDENRALDGLDLRREFIHEYAFNEDAVRATLSGPCSVLEMLVALCIRCEDEIMYDPEYGDRTALWFWDIMRNLEIDDQDDEHFNEDLVRIKVDIFVNRRFKKGAVGSPFPDPGYTEEEAKNTEFWSMMQSYLVTNF